MNKNANTCWICGDPATTGEHQSKKTDVTGMFGKASFIGVSKMDFDSGKKSIIQGANSKALKYRDNLCAKCNNERTQPYDRAYEQFVDYVRGNCRQLRKTLAVNTNLVFGKDRAKLQQQYLFRYFIKAFGCQLHDKCLSVPQDLKDALRGNNHGRNFRISICIDRAYQSYLAGYPLEGDQDERGNPVDYFWAQHNGWFTVVYAYNRPISPEFGEEWFGKTKRFRIGKWTDF